jgi:hypothetical protein
MLPKHYDTTNLLDMWHWCLVLREKYTLSGNRDAVENTYRLRMRIRKARERESFPLTEAAMEGFRVAQLPEGNEPPLR